MQQNELTAQPATATPAFIRGAGALAAYLGVHEMSVRRWQKQRRIPFVKLGGAVLFRKADVDALLEKLTVPAVGNRKPRVRKGA